MNVYAVKVSDEDGFLSLDPDCELESIVSPASNNNTQYSAQIGDGDEEQEGVTLGLVG